MLVNEFRRITLERDKSYDFEGQSIRSNNVYLDLIILYSFVTYTNKILKVKTPISEDLSMESRDVYFLEFL